MARQPIVRPQMECPTTLPPFFDAPRRIRRPANFRAAEPVHRGAPPVMSLLGEQRSSIFEANFSSRLRPRVKFRFSKSTMPDPAGRNDGQFFRPDWHAPPRDPSRNCGAAVQADFTPGAPSRHGAPFPSTDTAIDPREVQRGDRDVNALPWKWKGPSQQRQRENAHGRRARPWDGDTLRCCRCWPGRRR